MLNHELAWHCITARIIFRLLLKISGLGDVNWELTLSYWGLSPGTIYQITEDGEERWANKFQLWNIALFNVSIIQTSYVFTMHRVTQ